MAHFLIYCFPKNVTTLSHYNSDIHESILIIFGTSRQSKGTFFPPHLTNASALPGETGNLEIACFHLNAARFLLKTHEIH